MSKLEEIKESMEYFSKPVGLWDTAELVKHKQPLINLARLILEEKELPGEKIEYDMIDHGNGISHPMLNNHSVGFNSCLSEVRPIVARLRVEIRGKEDRDKELLAKVNEAKELVKDKVQETASLRSQLQKLRGENVGLYRLSFRKLPILPDIDPGETWKDYAEQLQAENSALREKVAGFEKAFKHISDETLKSSRKDLQDIVLKAKKFLEGV